MKYRKLGAAGVKVSELCLGTMTFGEADEQSFMHKIGMDEATSHAVLNRALELGVNFVDTADVYGQDGLSERVLGAWFQKDGRRDEVMLATKFRFTMGAGANKSGASRYRLRSCVEGSLRRLKTDRIDLLQVHMQDIDTPEEETLRALDDCITQGKVLYIGCSNYAASDCPSLRVRWRGVSTVDSRTQSGGELTRTGSASQWQTARKTKPGRARRRAVPRRKQSRGISYPKGSSNGRFARGWSPTNSESLKTTIACSADGNGKGLASGWTIGACETQCDDSSDNDGDGRADCSDPYCPTRCEVTPPAPMGANPITAQGGQPADRSNDK